MSCRNRRFISVLGTKYVSSVTFSVYSNFIYHKKIQSLAVMYTFKYKQAHNGGLKRSSCRKKSQRQTDDRHFKDN